jgi:hypothetical protein
MVRLTLNVDQETYDNAGRGFDPVPVGKYRANIFSITPDEVKNGDNKGKLRLKFRFQIAEGEVAADGTKVGKRNVFADVNAFDGVSKKTGEPTPPFDLVAIGKAIGLSAEEIENIDTDDWLGEELQVDVVHIKKQHQVGGQWVDIDPAEYKEKVRGYRSLESVETSVASTAKVNSGAKAGGKAKPSLIKL